MTLVVNEYTLLFPDWLQLTGLIHDVGKLLALWGEPQWAAVGDTFPVGCAFSEKCVFHSFFEKNPDNSHPVYRFVFTYKTTPVIDYISYCKGLHHWLYDACVLT